MVMTICTQCKHLRSSGPIWYQNQCGAVPKAKVVDPVSGLTGWSDTNDLGRHYISPYTSGAYKYCRDVNQGACELFVAASKHDA